MKYLDAIFVLCLLIEFSSVLSTRCISNNELESNISFFANSLSKEKTKLVIAGSNDFDIENNLSIINFNDAVNVYLYCIENEKINYVYIINQTIRRYEVLNIDIVTLNKLLISVENKNNLGVVSSFIEHKIKYTSLSSLGLITSDLQMFSQIKSSKPGKFLLSLGFLMLSLVLSFTLVRKTIDWATKAKADLNNYRDLRAKQVIDEINRKFNYLKRND